MNDNELYQFLDDCITQAWADNRWEESEQRIAENMAAMRTFEIMKQVIRNRQRDQELRASDNV